MLKSLTKYNQLGLLILRVGTGILFIDHGFDKFFGGPEKWEKIGSKMAYVGIDFLYVFWGFLAASSEFIGGFLILLGLFFRPTSIMLFLTMVVAVAFHFGKGDDFSDASHAMLAGIIFLSFLFIGPGKYSIDKR